MYKRIFVPVDDSGPSKLALAEACKLAKELGSEIRLAHVVELATPGLSGNEFLDVSELKRPIKEAGRQVLAIAEQQISEVGLLPTSKMLESWGDNFASLLNEEAIEWGADLVIMGTHGWTGLRHLLMGSVAEGVLKSSDVPVLLVRDGGDN